MPEFQMLRAAGDSYAALGDRAEAATIAKRIVDEVKRRRLSYLCYTTGASPGFMDHIKAASVAAYQTQVVMTSRPTNEAIARSMLRGDRSPTNPGRYANVDELKKGHAGASRNLAQWKNSVWVGSWRLYDTSKGMPSGDELGQTPEDSYMDADEDDSFLDLPAPRYESRTPEEDSAAVDQLLEQHQAGQIELPELPPLTDDA